MIVPTLGVGMHPVTLRVTVDAERPWRHYHPERANDLSAPHPLWAFLQNLSPRPTDQS